MPAPRKATPVRYSTHPFVMFEGRIFDTSANGSYSVGADIALTQDGRVMYRAAVPEGTALLGLEVTAPEHICTATRALLTDMAFLHGSAADSIHNS